MKNLDVPDRTIILRIGANGARWTEAYIGGRSAAAFWNKYRLHPLQKAWLFHKMDSCGLYKAFGNADIWYDGPYNTSRQDVPLSFAVASDLLAWSRDTFNLAEGIILFDQEASKWNYTAFNCGYGGFVLACDRIKKLIELPLEFDKYKDQVLEAESHVRKVAPWLADKELFQKLFPEASGVLTECIRYWEFDYACQNWLLQRDAPMPPNILRRPWVVYPRERIYGKTSLDEYDIITRSGEHALRFRLINKNKKV